MYNQHGITANSSLGIGTNSFVNTSIIVKLGKYSGPNPHYSSYSGNLFLGRIVPNFTNSSIPDNIEAYYGKRELRDVGRFSADIEATSYNYIFISDICPGFNIEFRFNDQGYLYEMRISAWPVVD